MEETASVKITRIASKFTNRKFDVYLDDNRRVGILNGETTTMQTTPGRHTLSVRSVSWIKSEEITFNADESASTDFECGYYGKRLVLFIIGMVVVLFAVDIIFILVTANMPARDSLSPYRWMIKIVMWLLYFMLVSRPGIMIYLKKL